MLYSVLNNQVRMKHILIIVFAFLTSYCFGQEIWSLERCIQLAQQNNLDYKLANVGIKTAYVDEKQSKEQRYPSLNMSTDLGLNMGRSVNPATYTFETKTSSYNSFGIQSSTPIYVGGRINNTIEQNKVNVEIAKADAQNILNNTSLNVAAAYLQIVLSEEQLDIANKRLDQTKRQLDQIEKLIAAGTRPQNEKLDVLAQIAKADQNLLTAENNVILNYLNLKQLLQIDPGYSMKVQRMNIEIPKDANPDIYTLSSVYGSAVSNLPVIKASELRILSAEKGLSIAKGVGLPSIYLNISAGTNYTNLGTRVDNISYIYTPISVRINGNPSVLDFPDKDISTSKNPYFNQLSENIGGGAGITVRVPIYNNGTIRAQKEKAMLNIRTAEIRNEQTKQQLKTDIQRAIANAKAALKQYEATVTTYNAALAAFENAEKRYKIGAISTYDFNTSRTTMDTSLVDVTLAKYDYIFKLKVVEFYEGKKLSINN
jgi:outer membrane protein